MSGEVEAERNQMTRNKNTTVAVSTTSSEKSDKTQVARVTSYNAGDKKFDKSLFVAAFKLFDEKKIERIYRSDLVKVLRSVGHNPSAKEMEEIFLRYSIKDGDMIPLAKAMQIAQGRPCDTMEAIVSAFRKFDKENLGYLPAEDVRFLLGTTGEKLSAQEMDEMLEFADKNREGKIYYEEFAKMIAPKPLTCLKPPAIKEPDPY